MNGIPPVRIYVQNAPEHIQFELIVERENGLVEPIKPRVMAHNTDHRPVASEAAKSLAHRRGYQLRVSDLQPHLGPMLRTGADAIAAGERYYMPDTPCKNGHPSAYYASGTKCVVCTQIRNNVLRPKDKAPEDWAKAVRAHFFDNPHRALSASRDKVMRKLVMTMDHVPMTAAGMPNRDLFNSDTVAKYADAIAATLAIEELDAADHSRAEAEAAKPAAERNAVIVDDRHKKTPVQLAQDMAPFDVMYDGQYGVASGTVNKWRVEAAQLGEDFVMPDIPLSGPEPTEQDLTASQPTAPPEQDIPPSAPVERPVAPPVDLSALSNLSLPSALPVSAPASPMAPVPPPAAAQSETYAPVPVAPPAPAQPPVVEYTAYTIVED